MTDNATDDVTGNRAGKRAAARIHSQGSGWRVVLMLGWVGGILGYSTIWAVSRQIGLPTWWLGPRSAPSPVYMVSLPFVLPVLILIGLAANLKRIATFSLLAAVLTFGIAAGDGSSQPGLALAQVAISVGLLCASLAAVIGARFLRTS